MPAPSKQPRSAKQPPAEVLDAWERRLSGQDAPLDHQIKGRPKSERLEQDVAPSRFKAPNAGQAEEFRWVTRVIGRKPETIRPEDAPSEAAWHLLRSWIDDPREFSARFYSNSVFKKAEDAADPDLTIERDKCLDLLHRIRKEMGLDPFGARSERNHDGA